MADVAYVALGSNLGERARFLADARERIAALPDTTIEAETTAEETDPIGPPGQGPYLNQMIRIRTGLSPRALLDGLLGIERSLGRVRTGRWQPRTIDLDIVQFGDRTIEEPGLQIPHPELPNRAFWQRELTELTSHG